MSDKLSQIPSDVFTVSAVLIGFLLIDDLTPSEQNSIGNWFMMIGQVLCTNSAQQQVINNQNNTSSTSPPIINENSPMSSLKKSIQRMDEEIQKY